MMIMMNDIEILDAKTEDRNHRDNNVSSPESEHKLIISQISPDKIKILPQFALPRAFSRSVPRRNKSLLRYRMNRSLDFDIVSPRKDIWSKSPNSSLGYSFDANKSLRNLSRSAKIMRALSSNSDFLRHQNISIKKTLNFDSTPSPKKKNSFDGNSSIDSINTDTPSPILDEVLSLDSSLHSISTSSMTASSESIDENQNQTPQQNRKITRISSNKISDAKGNANGSELSPSTSLLRKNLKEKIDNIVSKARTSDLQSFKQDNRSRACGSIMAASTPRNLFQEFYGTCHDEYNSSPDSIIHLNPKSMNAIKKSHKKEELQHEEKQSVTQMDISIRNENLHTETTMELSETNTFASSSSSTVSIKRSQKKNKSIKKMLVYDSDDELPSDIRLVFEYEPEVTPRKADLSENESDKIEDNKIQDTDSNDYEENVQDNVDFKNRNDKEDRSEENVCDREIRRSPLQEESSSICNVDKINENRAVSPEPNSTTQGFNGVTTPENHVNILQQISTESIKKSHKKVKHENGKALSKARILHHKIEPAKPEISAQDTCNDDQYEDNESKTEDTTGVVSPQNSDRPNTPENVNSSRLLLSQFNSIKKSHKKDKNSKRISGVAKCHKYHEYRKRTDNLLQNYRYEKKINDKVLRRNKSFDLKESPDVSPNKKKKSMNVTLYSDIHKFSFSPISPSSKCKNIDDEFKIYTPMRKRRPSTLLPVCADKTQEKDESAQLISKEIDCSRCLTPIVHRIGKSKESEDLVSEECAKTKRLSVDLCISNDGPANIVNLRDKSSRSTTPINMSTTELLCNIDSIKKSHKKDKHSGSICKRPILKKTQSNTEEIGIVNFASNKKERATPSLKFLGVDEMGMCSNTPYKKEHDDNPQPSTSRARDNIENAKNIKKSECLNTPPNSLNATNYIKLLHTTSIKRSHKKERDCNAQAKYILMSEEHDLSDDGSIFDEEDKFNFETYDQDSDNEIKVDN